MSLRPFLTVACISVLLLSCKEDEVPKTPETKEFLSVQDTVNFLLADLGFVIEEMYLKNDGWLVVSDADGNRYDINAVRAGNHLDYSLQPGNIWVKRSSELTVTLHDDLGVIGEFEPNVDPVLEVNGVKLQETAFFAFPYLRVKESTINSPSLIIDSLYSTDPALIVISEDEPSDYGKTPINTYWPDTFKVVGTPLAIDTSSQYYSSKGIIYVELLMDKSENGVLDQEDMRPYSTNGFGYDSVLVSF